MPTETQPQKNTVLMLLLIALSCLLVFLVAYEKRAFLYRVLDGFSVVPKEEHLTELYFEDHQDLPKTVTAGKEEAFWFTIRNLEGKDMNYAYQISFVPREESQSASEKNILSIATSSVSVLSGASMTTRVSYVLKDGEAKNGKVVVELVGRKERIHFLLNQ